MAFIDGNNGDNFISEGLIPAPHTLVFYCPVRKQSLEPQECFDCGMFVNVHCMMRVERIYSRKEGTMRPSKQEEQMNPGDMQKLRQEVIRNAVCEPAIEEPYIQVMFRKEKDGLWHTYSAYGTDIDYKTGAEFMNCIGKAADVLNKK